MAKPPVPPKAKAAAPAQFDMNSRDRKGGGGRGGPGGPGRGRDRDEKRPPSRIVSLPPTMVDRGEGWTIRKIGKIDQASHSAIGAEYELIFEGHDPMTFDYLGAARDRAKEPPPEKVAVAEAPAEEEPIEEEATQEAGPEGDEPASPEGEHTGAEAPTESTPPAAS